MYARHTVAAHRRGTRAGVGSLTLDHTFGSMAGFRAGDLQVKLSSNRFPVVTLTAVALATLAGCATTGSQAVVEKLDPNTATTLILIDKPVELVGEGAHGPTGNPFAFFAPFETDRSGARASYLWMSAPSIQGAKLTPKLLCDEHDLPLAPIDGDLAKVGLSSVPYASSVPWNMQWYFQLPADELDCLAAAKTVALETYGADGAAQRFTVDAKDLLTLKQFKDH